MITSNAGYTTLPTRQLIIYERGILFNDVFSCSGSSQMPLRGISSSSVGVVCGNSIQSVGVVFVTWEAGDVSTTRRASRTLPLRRFCCCMVLKTIRYGSHRCSLWLRHCIYSAWSFPSIRADSMSRDASDGRSIQPDGNFTCHFAV